MEEARDLNSLSITLNLHMIINEERYSIIKILGLDD